MKRYALLFPGQGTQFVGMGKKFYDKYDEVKKLYTDANDILGMNIMDLCFNGDIDMLTKTENAQPAILLAGVAAYRVLRNQIEENPVCMAGHSIGEITALTAAGYIQLDDALRLVQKRGKLMGKAAETTSGIMCAVLAGDLQKIETVCDKLTVDGEYVSIANYNSYDQIVLSGRESTVDVAIAELTAMGMRCIKLKVSGAFHSRLMEPALKEFEKIVNKIDFHKSDVPIIANVNANFYADIQNIPEGLTKQIVSPVQWIKTMELLKTQAIDAVIDAGPGNVVCNLAQKCKVYFDTFSFAKEQDKVFGYFNNDMQKVEDTVKYDHTIVSKCIAISVCTKNENNDPSVYDKGVVKPYRCMQALQKKIKSENRIPVDAECKEALTLLKKIFDTKKTSREEQEMRFDEIFNTTLKISTVQRNQWTKFLLEGMDEHD